MSASGDTDFIEAQPNRGQSATPEVDMLQDDQADQDLYPTAHQFVDFNEPPTRTIHWSDKERVDMLLYVCYVSRIQISERQWRWIAAQTNSSWNALRLEYSRLMRAKFDDFGRGRSRRIIELNEDGEEINVETDTQQAIQQSSDQANGQQNTPMTTEQTTAPIDSAESTERTISSPPVNNRGRGRGSTRGSTRANSNTRGNSRGRRGRSHGLSTQISATRSRAQATRACLSRGQLSR